MPLSPPETGIPTAAGGRIIAPRAPRGCRSSAISRPQQQLQIARRNARGDSRARARRSRAGCCAQPMSARATSPPRHRCRPCRSASRKRRSRCCVGAPGAVTELAESKTEFARIARRVDRTAARFGALECPADLGRAGQSRSRRCARSGHRPRQNAAAVLKFAGGARHHRQRGEGDQRSQPRSARCRRAGGRR